ncbi:MAG TPA: hypothetical protein VM053_02575 [Gemmatimonadaceae bacterium]|nr:hypothetical protein [Gemmatimonadaceae bacterium]
MQTHSYQSRSLARKQASPAAAAARRPLAPHEVDALRRASAGDPDAIGSLVDRWSGHLYHCTDALRIPAAEADDIVEEVLRRLIFEGPRIAKMPSQLGRWMHDTFKACAGAVLSRPTGYNRTIPTQSKVAQAFAALLASGGINDALRYLNSMTPFRFTAVYRVDGLWITNLVLFDRETGFAANGTPCRISDTFCLWVNETLSVVQLEDSHKDPRAIGHPKRDVVRSYCGGPVRNSDGLLIGTLCHFDYEPHSGTMPATAMLAEVGSLLVPLVGS